MNKFLKVYYEIAEIYRTEEGQTATIRLTKEKAKLIIRYFEERKNPFSFSSSFASFITKRSKKDKAEEFNFFRDQEEFRIFAINEKIKERRGEEKCEN
jgi:hypothetical protein